MLVYSNRNIHTELPENSEEEKGSIAFLNCDEIPGQEIYKTMPPETKRSFYSKISHFESHADLDYIFLVLPHKQGSCEIYLRENSVLFAAPDIEKLKKVAPRLFEKMEEKANIKPDNALAEFLIYLTEKDIQELYSIEGEIAKLEDSLLNKKEMDYGKKISELRKKLLALKQYYQSLASVVEDLAGNMNGFLGETALRNISIAENRANRFYGSVMYMRDYVTQIRESYQSELDLTLNEVMKLFTIVTVIFMPLGIVVGWYGMNLSMPEVAWGGMYYVVIFICVAMVVGIIWYFKRKKWL